MRTTQALKIFAALFFTGLMAFCGCRDASDVLLPAVPDFTAGPVEGVVPLAVQFTDTSAGSINTWQWDFGGDGTVDSGERNPLHTYTAPGSYSVTLTVSGPVGTETVIKTDVVAVYDLLQIATASAPDGVIGQAYGPLLLQALGGRLSLSWSLAAGSDALPGDLTLDPGTGEISGIPQAGTEGIYSLIVEVADSLGTPQTDTMVFQLTVRSSLLPEAGFVATPTGGTTPLAVSFIDLSTGNITSREWDFDNDGTPDSTDRNVQWTYTSPGWYTVTLTVSGPGGTDSLAKRKYISVYGSAWYVDASGGSDSNGGTSWADAFATIQTGIDAATDLELVLVADGTYTGINNRNLNFAGRKIYLKSAEGPENCVIDCRSQGRGFVFLSGETDDCVVDGFTVRQGNAVGDVGGGIACLNASCPTILNCVFDSNTADFGGGIFCTGLSDAVIAGCTVKNNYAVQYGGGIYCLACSPVIENCSVLYNQSEKSGGGIACVNDSDSTITGCRIESNIAYQFGGGIVFALNSNASMTDCSVTGNWSLGGGGTGGTAAGIYCEGSAPAVTGCTVDSNIGIDSSGGGIYLLDANPTISNTSFSGNRVTSDSGVGGNGAGICCSGSLTHVLFSNCIISDNQAAESGGGIVCTDYANATFDSCTVLDNRSADNGGGVLCTSYSSTTFTSSVVSYNFADSSGGGSHCNDSAFNAVNCLFYSNTAGGSHGGGIYCENSTVSLSGSTVSANGATGLGGGLHCENCSPVITSCIISGNTANTGAGICCRTDASPDIICCLIIRNIATDSGGGLCAFSACGPTVANCTISGNLALMNRGGGIFCFDPNPVLDNCIIWGNAASDGNQIYAASAGTTVTLNFCCIPGVMDDPGRFSGLASIDYANNCIEADPLFINAPGGNYRLQGAPTQSPCIDSGSNTLIPPGVTEDVEGSQRIVNSTVDVGAHEEP